MSGKMQYHRTSQPHCRAGSTSLFSITKEHSMNDLDVRIVRLEPLHVAWTNGFGPSPEGVAWERLLDWAKAKGLMSDGQAHRFFGYNNPDPSPASPNYGYDTWITVDRSVQPEGEIHIRDFPGGLYAVTRCQGVDTIFPTWQKFVRWREESRYHSANHQWLEEHIGNLEVSPEEMVLDLYLPIAE
jgi:DNA gyrase inhibitor GyrI